MGPYLEDDEEEVFLLTLSRLHLLLQPLDLLLQLTLFILLAVFLHVLVVPAVPLSGRKQTECNRGLHSAPSCHICLILDPFLGNKFRQQQIWFHLCSSLERTRFL